MITASRLPLRYVSEDLDCADWGRLEPVLRELVDRPIGSVAELGGWLADMSELDAVLSEYRSRCSIDHSRYTEDEEIEKRYLHMIEAIVPKVVVMFFELQKKLVGSEFAEALVGLDPKFKILRRDYDADVSIYREENVALQTEASKATTRYGKISGAMTVDFEGETKTLPQMTPYLQETDRAVRERAWRAVAGRRLQDREAIDSIFTELMGLRGEIAKNAGFESYRDYTWKSMKRFDYSPGDCLRFADAIEKVCVPKVAALDRERMETLGVRALRPWDLSVDALGRGPLRPFGADAEGVAKLVSKTGEIFDRVSPLLAERFRSLEMGRNLDLESRPAKRPGGYQSSLERSREAFIFMNAAGLQSDVETLLHEAGHAFHYMAASEEPIVDLRQPGLEFCEVASMSMELLGMDHFGIFYGEDAKGKEDAARAKRQQLEGIVRFFPWMATIDMFQHRLYSELTAESTVEERTALWMEVRGRFASDVVDHTGDTLLEESLEALWHRQLHLFHYPFYYIEYGVAQMGAMQVWLNYRDDPAAALEALLGAFEQGRKLTLPALFEAAGAKLDFTEATLGPLIAAVEEELAVLPV